MNDRRDTLKAGSKTAVSVEDIEQIAGKTDLSMQDAQALHEKTVTEKELLHAAIYADLIAIGLALKSNGRAANDRAAHIEIVESVKTETRSFSKRHVKIYQLSATRLVWNFNALDGLDELRSRKGPIDLSTLNVSEAGDLLVSRELDTEFYVQGPSTKNRPVAGKNPIYLNLPVASLKVKYIQDLAFILQVARRANLITH